jgi:hypothetical protein
MYLGYAGYFSTKLCEQPELSGRLATLLVDARWPWPLKSVVFGLRAAWDKSSRRMKLTAKDGAARLKEGFLHAEHRDASLDHSSKAEDNYVRLSVDTGQRLAVPSWPNPAELSGVIKGKDVPEGSSLESWLEVMHQIMRTLDIANAVISPWPTERMAHSDMSFSGTVIDSPSGVRNLGVGGSFALQNSRASYWRPELGDKYIRHPRWGTYLRREHLDRVGGLSPVRDVVPLAKVIELGGAGDLIYLQCTEHPAGALTPEGERVRQALEDVLAPIVAPPRPQEQAQG